MPLTTLIGRERDLEEVTALVADNRLVTLIGSGGVGKTRLAIEEAAAIAPRFDDGVDLDRSERSAGSRTRVGGGGPGGRCRGASGC